MNLVGIDIGGTKIEACLVSISENPLEHKGKSDLKYQKDTKKNNKNKEGKNGSKSKSEKNLHKNETFTLQLSNSKTCYLSLRAKKRAPTERLQGYEQIIGKIRSLVHDICKENNVEIRSLAGVGLSVPGPVEPTTGLMHMSNSMIMTGRSLHADLIAALSLKCPIISENDANCFALAEAVCGAGLEHSKKTGIPINDMTAVGLILGSGFGGGVVIQGKVLRGLHGGAGEFGHMTLYANGHPCYCGRLGCAEQYLCGPALEAAFQARTYAQIQNRPSSAEIFKLYEMQDPIAFAVVKKYKNDLAKFLGNLVAALNPHYFVFGGGVSLQPFLYQDLEKKIAENTYYEKYAVPVYQHRISDSAGAIGAVLNVMRFL